jgi:rhodanese-related sulfurtransferase
MKLLHRPIATLNPNEPGARNVTAREAAQLISEDKAVLVDVREPSEWEYGVAAPAHLLPLSDLKGRREKWASFLPQHRERELILYCLSGGRSGSAATILSGEGFRVANLGGLAAWRGARLPIRQPSMPAQTKSIPTP